MLKDFDKSNLIVALLKAYNVDAEYKRYPSSGGTIWTRIDDLEFKTNESDQKRARLIIEALLLGIKKNLGV